MTYFSWTFGKSTATSQSYLLLLMFLLATLFPSCAIIKDIATLFEDSTTRTISVIDNAIAELGLESDQWQEIMREAIEEIPRDLQSTIGVEIDNTLQRGIASTGEEFRCNIDFLSSRMIIGLRRIKAKLTDSPAPEVTPVFCQIVPRNIDMNIEANRRNKISFHGFDFDQPGIRAVVIRAGGVIDATSHLSIGTHYSMTLNLGRNGLVIGENDRAIRITFGGQELSTIPIIQKFPDECDVEIRSILPSPVSFIPPHLKGDRDYDGHGPRVHSNVNVFLNQNQSKIIASVFMGAVERKKDWTAAKGSREFIIHSVDPGWTITRIISPTEATINYIDNDFARDIFSGDGPVRRFVFMGDGRGDDAGIHTGVTVQFNDVRFEVKQTEDCVN